MKRYLFFRHAEPENQAPGFVQQVMRNSEGRADHPLSVRGREQATRLIDATRTFGAEIMMSSSLLRSKETADIIASELDLPRLVDPDLAEVNPGRSSLSVSLADPKAAAVSLALATAYLVDRSSAKRAGETAHQLLARIERVFAKLAEMAESRIAIVSHGYWIFTSAMLISPSIVRSLLRTRYIAHGASMLIERSDEGRLRVVALDPVAKR